MVQLHSTAGAMALDAVGQFLESGNEFILVSTDVHCGAREFVHGGIADTDHAHTPAGPLSIKFNELFRDLVIFRHVHMHGRQIDSVLDLQPADGDGIE